MTNPFAPFDTFRTKRSLALTRAARKVTDCARAPVSQVPNFTAIQEEFNSDMREAVKELMDSDAMKHLIAVAKALESESVQSMAECNDDWCTCRDDLRRRA